MKRHDSKGAAGLRNRARVIILVSLCLAAVLPYANTLENEFVYDDQQRIVENPLVQDVQYSRAIFRHLGRPVLYLSLLVDYQLWKTNPPGWHLTNIGLHVVATLLVFFLVRGLISSARAAGRRASSGLGTDWIAWTTAVLFAVHPVHVEAVTGISNRQEMLMTIFLVSSLILYGSRRRTYITYPAALIALILALGSKQLAFVGALLWVLRDIWCESGSLFSILKRRSIRYLPLIAVAVLAVTSLRRLGIEQHAWGVFSPGWFNAVFYPFFYYIELLLWPHNLSVFVSLHAPGTIASQTVLGITILLLFIALIALTYRSRHPLGLAAAAYIVSWLPLSNVVRGTFLVAERYLYFPSLWFLMGVSVLLASVVAYPSLRLSVARQRTVLVACCIVAALLASWRTVVRNGDWKNEETLWRAAVVTDPCDVSHYHLGTLLMASDAPEECVSNLRSALLYNPGNVRAANNLGVALMRLARYEEASEAFNRALAADPRHANSMYNMACISSLQGRVDEAHDWLTKLKELGVLNLRQVETDPALRNYRDSHLYGELFHRQGEP